MSISSLLSQKPYNTKTEPAPAAPLQDSAALPDNATTRQAHAGSEVEFPQTPQGATHVPVAHVAVAVGKFGLCADVSMFIYG